MKKSLITLSFICFAMLLFAQRQTPADVQNEARLKILPVLWQQTAAEYRALCYQAFNLATLRINTIPAAQKAKGHLAIITDIDETILDNSPQEAELIKTSQAYTSKDWREWTTLATANAVPGAIEFLQLAKKKGISVFYISNRDTTEVLSTIKNLKKLQLPDADAEHMVFMTRDPSKETRRKEVMKKYNVVLLLGDNLNDFMQIFEKVSIDTRKTNTDKEKEEWGKKFIVLPNSTYGEWENALYSYSHNLTPLQKDSIRLHLLKSYK